MTRSLTRESLTVVVDGEEVPGLIFYGLGGRDDMRPVRFPTEAWVARPDVDEFTLHGEAWRIAGWELPIVIWPNAARFTEAVHRTLTAIIDSGCRVAWVGAEGLPFCDPPELFDSACMSGGVLAWMTDDGAFVSSLDPDGPLEPVSDEQSLALRVHARGLADAP